MPKPAATSPTDPFRWTDKRSIGAQVAGGFGKAGRLIGGFGESVGAVRDWFFLRARSTEDRRCIVYRIRSYYAANSISRVELVEFLAYAVAVVVLTSRFVGKHQEPTTLVGRFALTFFVVATFRQVVIPYRFPPKLHNWPNI